MEGVRVPYRVYSGRAVHFQDTLKVAGYVALLHEIEGNRARGEEILGRMRRAWGKYLRQEEREAI